MNKNCSVKECYSVLSILIGWNKYHESYLCFVSVDRQLTLPSNSQHSSSLSIITTIFIISGCSTRACRTPVWSLRWQRTTPGPKNPSFRLLTGQLTSRWGDPRSHPALAPKIDVNFKDAKVGFGRFFDALNLNPVENNFRTLISKATALPIVPPPH